MRGVGLYLVSYYFFETIVENWCLGYSLGFPFLYELNE